MLEKDESNILNSLWEAEHDMDPREETQEEEIHTYRVSNPCTPIDDLNAIPSEIDSSFL